MNLIEVKELLRRFGILVYTGNRLDDLVLMEFELNDLFHEKLIDQDEYLKAKAVLSREIQSANSMQK
jgi:uncharacterized protein YqgQ